MACKNTADFFLLAPIISNPKYATVPKLYCVWFVEYCQTSLKENKSPNPWPITSILVCCIFYSRNLLFAFWSLHSSYVVCQHNSLRRPSSGKQESNPCNWRKTDKWGLAFGWCQIEPENQTIGRLWWVWWQELFHLEQILFDWGGINILHLFHHFGSIQRCKSWRTSCKLKISSS